MKNVNIFLFILFSITIKAQIIIDGNFDEWSTINPIYQDTKGDSGSSGIDFQKVWITNDSNYLFIRFETTKEINLQSSEGLTLYLDIDNNNSTGKKGNNKGVEITYNFGLREGYIYDSSGRSTIVYHHHVDLISSPTITSNEFEVMIDLENLNNNEEISFYLYDLNGDRIPEEEKSIKYKIQDSSNNSYSIELEKINNNDIRLMTFNGLRDAIMNGNSQKSFNRILKALDPNIIVIQELYDTSANKIKNNITSTLGGEWYASKVSTDLILVSKYPIKKSFIIGNEAGYILNIDDRELVIFNIHLSCCDKNNERQSEVDELMAFIRKMKENPFSIGLNGKTPYIITGDSNLVGNNRQLKTLLTGDIRSNSKYGEDFQPDHDGTDLIFAQTNTTGIPAAVTWYDKTSSYSPGRLDYVIYTDSELESFNNFALFTPQMTGSELYNYQLEKYDSQNASDHLATIFDFKFKGTVNTNDQFLEDYTITNDNNKLIVKTENTEAQEFMITNSRGQVIMKNSIIKGYQEYDISSLYSGIYFLTIVTNQRLATLKFVKK